MVLIGNSFFRPYAENLDVVAADAGYDDHSSTLVFRGGENGIASSFWDDSTSQETLSIKAALDAGGVELFAMTASIARAIALEKRGAPNAKEAAALADMFCNNSRRVVEETFYALWHNDDDQKVAITKQVMGDEFLWMEEMARRIDPLEREERAVEAPAAR